jgi:ABC-2 type transport system permease protein
MTKKISSYKTQHLIQLFMLFAVIILLNIVSSFFFTRIDLTSEKRYTISRATRDLIRNIDEPMLFKVYLDGEMPPEYKRLRNETREMLTEMIAYNRDIMFDFIDPNAETDQKARSDLQLQIYNKGLMPRQITNTAQGKVSTQTIFPGAIVSYQGKEIAMPIFRTRLGRSEEQMINNSIQQLEYTFASTIKMLTTQKKPTVGFTAGHGELSEQQTAGARAALAPFYEVSTVQLDERGSTLFKNDPYDSTRIIPAYDALIIAKPESPFSRKDAFLLDQFIMNGGRVLWFIDPVKASMDALQDTGVAMGMRFNLGIEQQLFNYGVRLNSNLIKDLNCLPVPMNIQPAGAKPEFRPFPWYFSPVLTSQSDHPIVKNLNDLRTEFISSIDTIEVSGVQKTILLTTSRYSKTERSPVPISLRLMLEKQNPELYQEPYLPVAVLLEGEFPSFWQALPQPSDQTGLRKIDVSLPTKMLVVADGDIIKNQFQQDAGGIPRPLPLGYDRFTQATFGNQDFLLNAMNYMLDDARLLEARSKEFRIRRLDPNKLNNKTLILRWQMFTVAGPIFVVFLVGIGILTLRKRKYGKVIRSGHKTELNN